MKKVTDIVWELAEPVVKENGCELWDVEYVREAGQWYLRIYLDKAGGVDIQLLGLGHNGHIGFNEPADSFPSHTHEVKLTQLTREANKRFFSSIDDVPEYAFTMGIGTVMAARRIVLIATGADKADILRQAFFGPVKPAVPASILQFHGDVTVICDRGAARLLPE